MDQWIVNGEPADRIASNDRGLAYGDGLFETIRIQNSACMFFAAHLDRLAAGCAALNIPAPDPADLAQTANALIDTQQCATGTLKIIVTRGTGERGYRYDPHQLKPTVMVGIEARAAPPERPDGVRVRYCTTQVSRNPALAGIKSLNRLPQVIARAEWRDPAIAEGLMADDRANLIAGTMTNLFIVKDNRILTAPVDECGIAGIVRAKVIDWANAQGIDCAEQYFGRPDLESATEVFLTNSLIGIWPVRQVGEQQFAVAGPLTGRMLAEWQRVGAAGD